MECFVKAFRFLVSNFPIDRITHNQSSVVTKYRDMILKQIQMMFLSQSSMAEGSGSLRGQSGKGSVDTVNVQLNAKKGEVTDRDLLSCENETEKASAPTAAAKEPDAANSESGEDLYPCILAMMGSGGAIIKAIIQMQDPPNRSQLIACLTKLMLRGACFMQKTT